MKKKDARVSIFRCLIDKNVVYLYLASLSTRSIYYVFLTSLVIPHQKTMLNFPAKSTKVRLYFFIGMCNKRIIYTHYTNILYTY